MQIAFNTHEINATGMLIVWENSLNIITTPKTFNNEIPKDVKTGTSLFSLNILSPIFAHKRHKSIFKNKFIPNPEKKNISCRNPLTTPIKIASSFPLIIE